MFLSLNQNCQVASFILVQMFYTVKDLLMKLTRIIITKHH